MRKNNLVIMAVCVAIALVLAIPASGSINTDASYAPVPVVGELRNYEENLDENFFAITNNQLGQQVISYNKNPSKNSVNDWDNCLAADVTDYTPECASEYTLLSVTAAFSGVRQFAIEIPYQDLEQNLGLLWSEFEKNYKMTENADGSVTFNIPLPKDNNIQTNGITTILFFLDPEVTNVSGIRTMTIIDVSFVAEPEAKRPTISEFDNFRWNDPPDFFKVEKNANGKQVISYNKYSKWEPIIAYVGGYSPEYTRLCMTIAFSGTQTFEVAIVPGRGHWVGIHEDDLAPGQQSTLNDDGSYTFDIPLSEAEGVREFGLTGIVLVPDAEISISDTRSLTILDIGFRKDGEPAGSLDEPPDDFIPPGDIIKIVSASSDRISGTDADWYTFTVNTNIPAAKITFDFDNGPFMITYSINADGTHNLYEGSPYVSANKMIWKWLSNSMPPGSNRVTVTAYANGNTDIATFMVEVTTAQQYGISLTPTGTFPDAIVGYDSQRPKTITVTNIGSKIGDTDPSTDELTVSLSGANASAFSLSDSNLDSIAEGRSRTFNITPLHGLSAGTYTATVTVSDGNITDLLDVSFKVTSTAEHNFVAVTDITGVPSTATVGTQLALTGNVTPATATYKTLTWSVNTLGGTGAVISNGNILNTTAAGTVTVTATIANGKAIGTSFTKDFDIKVTAASSPPNGFTGGGGGSAPPEEPVEVPEDPVPQIGAVSFSSFIQGFEDHTFRRDDPMTREQFVAILARLKNNGTAPKATNAPPSYNDVSRGRWSYASVEWAKKAEIIEVGDDGLFRPEDPITRADMAVMLVRAENLTEMAESIFTDTKNHPAADDIRKAVAAKIFNGYPDGTFKPEAGTTRSEAVAALIRYLLGGEPTDDMWKSISITFIDVPHTNWAFKYIALAVYGYVAIP